MPDPPSANPIAHYLFENPLYLIVALVLAAVLFLFLARGSVQHRRKFIVAGILAAVLAIATYLAATFITTPGEHAEDIAHQLIGAAENADVAAAQALFADDAIMSLSSPNNPGVGIETIHRRLRSLDGQYRITSAKVLSLKSFTEDADTATVHLSITTGVSAGMGFAMPSKWVIRVRRQRNNNMNDSWKIQHLTFVEYGQGQSPTNNVFR